MAPEKIMVSVTEAFLMTFLQQMNCTGSLDLFQPYGCSSSSLGGRGPENGIDSLTPAVGQVNLPYSTKKTIKKEAKTQQKGGKEKCGGISAYRERTGM